MNVGEQMGEAIVNDHALLAHGLWLGVRKGYWDTGDNAEGLDFDKLDFAELEQVTKENPLSIKTNKLYAVSVGDNTFAMYFAEKEGQVMELHSNIYRQKAVKVLNMETKMDSSFYSPTTGTHQTWREYRDALVVFPTYAFEFQKS